MCDKVEQMFTDLSASYYDAGGIRAEISTHKTIADLRKIYRMIYDSFDVFRLLVVGSEGSSKAGFFHTIVEYEVEHTLAYFNMLMKQRGTNVKLNRTVIHIISESYIDALLEPVRHSMPYEEAVGNLEFLCAFYTGGWKTALQELFCSG